MTLDEVFDWQILRLKRDLYSTAYRPRSVVVPPRRTRTTRPAAPVVDRLSPEVFAAMRAKHDARRAQMRTYYHAAKSARQGTTS
jgi:hypothetical protein